MSGWGQHGGSRANREGRRRKGSRRLNAYSQKNHSKRRNAQEVTFVGLIWKTNKNDRRTSSLKSDDVIFTSKNSVGSPMKPTCCLCVKPYCPDLMYIHCERCRNWIHGDALELEEARIIELISYRFCRCQRCWMKTNAWTGVALEVRPYDACFAWYTLGTCRRLDPVDHVDDVPQQAGAMENNFDKDQAAVLHRTYDGFWVIASGTGSLYVRLRQRDHLTSDEIMRTLDKLQHIALHHMKDILPAIKPMIETC